MFDVVTMGELIIDFTPAGNSEQGQALFECNPGGAPANVAVLLAKLGMRTAFLGKVGTDRFGELLRNTLQKYGVNTEGLRFSEEVHTTLAFVHLTEHGERSFSFCRNPGADLTLDENELNYNLIEKSRVFHFGSLSMTAEPAKTATLKALKHAKSQGLLITFDPNLRESLWNSLADAKKAIEEGLSFADILKVSQEELIFLTGRIDPGEGTLQLMRKFDIPLIFVTLGERGCFYRYLHAVGTAPAYPVRMVDSTGAGDAFVGAAIGKILGIPDGFNGMTVDDVAECVRFANAAGALATTQKGGIPALPDRARIERFFRELK
ncbi:MULTISPECIES: carbohydrate kinase family protein [Paenibacillus]|uniref:Carbohydrate kinase n=1 Tax=Paenibacillus lautus TaxID=1401 RepID=A0A1R1AU39_PAELA|nr:carbohydrate kinase [Paenibacillus lautus]OME89080.1 carbohydrate kinase [Paenibacillus lautus]